MKPRYSSLLTELLLLSMLLFASGCHSSKSRVRSRVLPATIGIFQPGQITDSVPCTPNGTNSYALYLPPNYNANKKFPVVFFFDAHARGLLIVEKYKEVADSLSFILVASNNSKNGQTATVRNHILYNFMKDVERRFSIDPQRIYTAGFSGGARIAAGIGLSNKSIAGTIGIAAGFPEIQQIPNTHLAWVGIVGNKDFNYLEMKNLNMQLSSIGMRHLLLVYPGIHALPPPALFKKAFYFLVLDAMRKHIIATNQTLINLVKSSYNQIRSKAKKQHDCLQLLDADQALVANLKGLINVLPYQEEIKKLSISRSCRHKREQEKLQNKTEEKLQQKFARAMTMRNADWWNAEINHLYKEKKAALNTGAKLMNQRLLNYLSLLSYLYADGSLNNRQTEAAGKFLMIYEKVDPKNPEVYFLKAQRFAMTGETKAILPSLQKAANNGFHDVKRMEDNPYFVGLQQNPVFRKILLQVKENKKEEKE